MGGRKPRKEQGRPKLTEEEIKGRLGALGWELAGEYTGYTDKHILYCPKCKQYYARWINCVIQLKRGCRCRGIGTVPAPTLTPDNTKTEKVERTIKPSNRVTTTGGWHENVMDANLIKAPVFIAPPTRDNKTIDGIVSDIVKERLSDITEELVVIKDELASVKELLLSQQDLIITTAMNREDLIKKFTDAFNKVVARKGYIKYNRAMDTEEWLFNAHELALDLIQRLDPAVNTTLTKNYTHLRRTSPVTKPEKLLLKCMNKTQLFNSLEQLHILKLML